MGKWLIAWVTAVMVATSSPTFADSWAPAKRETYVSPDEATRLTVVPRALTDSLAYFSDKVEGKEPAGQQSGGEPGATAILERRSGTAWVKVWEAPLVNDVAPVSALVANGGKYVVTFDDWHSVGLGNNVVAIYRHDGTLVRSMKLADIVPDDYIRALPRSVSSLWWAGKHSLTPDGMRAVVKVVIPSSSRSLGHDVRGFVDVHIDLETGRVAPLTGPDWARANAAAAPVIARSKAEEAGWRAQLIAPLVAPSSDEEDEWSRYLYQAMQRLVPSDARGSLRGSWVLPATGNSSFEQRKKDIRAVFVERDSKSDLAFASPLNPQELALLLNNSANAASAGRLTGSRLFIALPPNVATGVRTALARTGATVIMFDPSVPIPQRMDQLQSMNVPPDRIDAEVARANADVRFFEAEAKRLDALAPPDPPAATVDQEAMEMMADALEAAADRLEAASQDRPK